MGEYVRDALSNRDRTEVRAHLDTCDGCRAALFEVSDLNQTLRLLIAPAVLGGAAIAGHYLTAVGAGAAKGSIFGSVRLHQLRNPAVAATVVAAVIAAGIGSAFALGAFDTAHRPAAAPAKTAPTGASVSPPSTSPPPAPILPVQVPSTATTSPTSPGPSRSASIAASTPAPSSPAPHLTVVVSSSKTPTSAKPPGQESTTVTFDIITSQPAASATTALSTTDGWTITDITLIVNGQPAPNASCTWAGPTPGCTLTNVPVGDQQYNVTAVSPAVKNPTGQLNSTYADDNQTLGDSYELGSG